MSTTISTYLPLDSEVAGLLAPLSAPLELSSRRLAEVLGPTPPLRVGLAEHPRGFARLDGDGCLRLDVAFLGGAHHHPTDAARADRLYRAGVAVPGRWERLCATLLEAQVRWGLVVRLGLSPARLELLEESQSWSWAGLGVWWSGELVPGVDLRAVEGVELAGKARAPARWGRAGWWLWRHLAAQLGAERTQHLAMRLALEVDDPPEALPDRALSLAVALAPRAAAAHEEVARAWAAGLLPGGDSVPDELNPIDGMERTAERWELHWWEVQPRPDVEVALKGEGFTASWQAGGWQEDHGTPHHAGRVLVTLPPGARLELHTLRAPLSGKWQVASAAYGGRIFGVRGVELEFAESGRAHLNMGDAFLGPLDEGGVEISRLVGVSGSGRGRWWVSGGKLHFSDLTPPNLVLHSRDGAMAVPTGDGVGPMAMFAHALTQVPWTWGLEDEELLLHGTLGGVPAMVRLSREQPEYDPRLPEA